MTSWKYKPHPQALVTVDDGMIYVYFRDEKKPDEFSSEISPEGCRQIGKEMYNRDRHRWQYSSSVDWPDDNGYVGPWFDLREDVEAGYLAEFRKDHPEVDGEFVLRNG